MLCLLGQPGRAQVGAPHDLFFLQQRGGALDQLRIGVVLFGPVSRAPPPALGTGQHAADQRPIGAGIGMQRPALPPQLDQRAIRKEHALIAGVRQMRRAVPQRDPGSRVNLRLNARQFGGGHFGGGKGIDQPRAAHAKPARLIERNREDRTSHVAGSRFMKSRTNGLYSLHDKRFLCKYSRNSVHCGRFESMLYPWVDAHLSSRAILSNRRFSSACTAV